MWEVVAVIQSKRPKFQPWQWVGVLLSLAAMWAFFEDVMKADWIAWLLPPLLVGAFCAALWRIKPRSFARNGLWFLAILIVAFAVIYDLLDLILDPIIRSDYLIAAAALVVLAGLWASLSAVIAVEEG
jgi:hypothetical protein